MEKDKSSIMTCVYMEGPTDANLGLSSTTDLVTLITTGTEPNKILSHRRRKANAKFTFPVVSYSFFCYLY